MKIEDFIKIIDSDFFTGIPDSLLRNFIDYLMNKYGINPKHHIIGTNEGNCLALGIGYHLSTGKVPVIYLQNSGIGNIVNPIASLINDDVYSIPIIFIIGYRGEQGIKDEPQHIFQGKITTDLLKILDIEYMIISKETTIKELENQMVKFKNLLNSNKRVAFVVKKGTFENEDKIEYNNNFKIIRKEALRHITQVLKDIPIVSTTGKISRELYEIREENNQSHKFDFLTVGAMGFCSSIALGIAINKKNKICTIEGDGAILMQMGSMPLIANCSIDNLCHILINNNAHESVGAMPTPVNNIDFCALAKATGYKYVKSVDNYNDLDKELNKIKSLNELSFLEIKTSITSDKNLKRPSKTPKESKADFVNYLKNIM